MAPRFRPRLENVEVVRSQLSDIDQTLVRAGKKPDLPSRAFILGNDRQPSPQVLERAEAISSSKVEQRMSYHSNCRLSVSLEMSHLR